MTRKGSCGTRAEGGQRGWVLFEEDRLLPGSRTELLSRLVLIVIVCSLVYAVIFAVPLRNGTCAAILIILAAASWLLPRLYRVTGSLSAAVHTFAGVLFVALNCLTCLTGGLVSPALMWMSIVPMMSTMLMGPRTGGVWLAVVILQVSLVGIIDPAEFQKWQSVDPVGLRWLMMLSVVGLAASVFACLTAEYLNIVQAHKHLQYQARHDGVTGLLNHRALLSLLGEVSRQDDAEEPAASPEFAIIILDLDHFKRVNDCYGHAAGDLALQEAARRLSRCLRASDHVGRYGGEEFLCILPGCPLRKATEIAETIRDAIESPYFSLDRVRIPVTVSLGVAVFDPQYDGDAMETLQRADRALYAAKGGGRNQVRVADHRTNADFETDADLPARKFPISDTPR